MGYLMRRLLICASPFFMAQIFAQPVEEPYEKLPDADPQLKALVEQVTNNRATAIKWFSGPSNMLGVIIGSKDNPNNPGVVAWATPDKKYLFIGQLLDTNQRNLTALSAEHYKAIEPTISLSSLHTNGGPESLFSEANLKDNLISILSFLANQGNAVAAGTGNKAIFVFIDPFCPYCESLVNEIELMPEYTKDMTIYYFPVFLAQENVEAAAQILMQGADTIKDFHGSKSPDLPAASDDAKARVAMNNALLMRIVEAAGINSFATPTIVVQQNEKANIYQGTVKKENFAAFLDSVEVPTVKKIQDIVQLPAE